MKYKVCRGCGTRVPMSKEKCPVCGTTDFTIVDEPEEETQTLDWAPDGSDNTTKLFPLTGNHHTVQRDPEDDAAQKPSKKQMPKKKKTPKKKTETRKASEKGEHTGVNFEHLLKRFPPVTRVLIMILSALVVIVLVVGIVAAVSRKPAKTAVASASPTAGATASASAQAAGETARADGQPIGKAVITADTIKIRTEPNTDAGVLGIVQKDDQYDVYEVETDGSYTWYCIGSEKWIADDGGEWVIYTAGK